MIQSPGGGSACHGVSLFIWREYGLQDDCDARKKEIWREGKKKEKRRALPPVVVSTQCCVAVLGGRHILDGRGGDFTGKNRTQKNRKICSESGWKQPSRFSRLLFVGLEGAA